MRLHLIYRLVILISLTFLTSCKEQFHDKDSKIILGEWVSDDDPNVQLFFGSKGTLIERYKGTPDQKSLYKLTNTCGNEYEKETIFLKIIDNDSDIRCFEIFTISKEILSLRYLDNGKLFLYKRLAVQR